MSDNQVATGIIRNGTAYDLVLVKFGLSWGRWVTEPLKRIPRHSSDVEAFVAQGRTASPSGTEGWVQYALEDPTSDISKPKKPFANVTLNFDDPWSGKNKISASSDVWQVHVETYVPARGSRVPFSYYLSSAPA